MPKALNKIDGIRIEAIGGRNLQVKCGCSKVANVSSAKLMSLLDGKTKIKDVIPLMHCVECGKRNVTQYYLVD